MQRLCVTLLFLHPFPPEVFTDKLGRQLFRVVQIGSADEFDGFEDSSSAI